MLAQVEITPFHWAGFIIVILVLLSLDLGVFHRRPHVFGFREAMAWSTAWFALALGFFAALTRLRGRQEALEFFNGYIIELSLSMDNVFVMAVIFAYFRVPLEYQHRVLFWGILGALLMRGAMIGLGAILLYTGIRMIFVGDKPPDPERNVVLRLVRKLFPVSPQFHGQRFFI